MGDLNAARKDGDEKESGRRGMLMGFFLPGKVEEEEKSTTFTSEQ